MTPGQSFAIDAEQARWITAGGPTITVASCDSARRPSLGQGIGCRVAPAGARLTVFLAEGRTPTALLADLRAGREVAVVVTSSFTTRSLQLKATSAREVPLVPGDLDRIASYVGAVAAEWSTYGVPETFTRALLAREPGPIVAFEIAPVVAFDQTPGPRAGTVLSP